MSQKSPTKSPTPVLATKHKDKRANIPTEELRDFVADDEKAPKKILYPRDPSLDPQLVWKGKDDQDRQPLEVPAVPIYIQEKIHPQVIIENLRAHPPVAADVRRLTSKKGDQSLVTSAATEERRSPDEQLNLFASDFNGLKFEHLIEFYQHKDGVKWANRMILGDSLLVMNSLAEKEGLKGRVQMIYLDPPYGIRFGSNWQVSTRKRDVKDGKAEDATRQPEQIRAFRDTWKLGIHSYLAYLRDRLSVARELLTESGSVFVQIGDENVHLVRSIMDEVFGSDCHVVTIVVKKKGGQKSGLLDPVNDYLLWYSKASRHESEGRKVKFRSVFEQREVDDATLDEFRWIELSDGKEIPIASLHQDTTLREFLRSNPNSRLFRPWPITNGGERANQNDPIKFHGREILPPKGRCWSHTSRAAAGLHGMQRINIAERLVSTGGALDFKRYLEDFPYKLISNWWDGLGGASEPIYVVQTNPEIVKRCLLMTTDPGDLVLDPTCGSGTTAYVAEQWGRRWITCDTSRVAIALARTRLMAAKFPYYLLADSEDGWRKEMEAAGKFVAQASSPASSGGVPAASAGSGDAPATRSRDGRATFEGDIKRGFVYNRVSRITSGSIANNEEIDAIHAEFAPRIEKALAALNKAVGRVPSRGAGSGDPAYKEWEVPKELEPLISANPRSSNKEISEDKRRLAVSFHSEFWSLRRERQQAIDAAIARRADTELLYDQPYEDNKRIRVTGPFTVESLSPHRFLSADDRSPRREEGESSDSGKRPLPYVGGYTVSEQEARQHHDFAAMILDNLRKAGIQNTRKEERLKFHRLDPFAGTWLHATGDFTDKDGKPRRAAVCLGPEHGTVGPDLVKEAAKEAVQGVGFDLLIVCGFAFDPHVSEEMKRYGKLAILPARMNPDLAMGDELLKKTGAGNLFMVFGEPDVEIREVKKGAPSPALRAPSLLRGEKHGVRGTSAAGVQLVAEIKGLDIYDPTTGQIRNSTTDDIACWFIDTDYNGESFFVRHAYFSGADEPYEKLKRALRADIDETAWSSLYSTVSRTFDKPKTGKIAIKVINHYGDEVLKVYEV